MKTYIELTPLVPTIEVAREKYETYIQIRDMGDYSTALVIKLSHDAFEEFAKKIKEVI